MKPIDIVDEPEIKTAGHTWGPDNPPPINAPPNHPPVKVIGALEEKPVPPKKYAAEKPEVAKPLPKPKTAKPPKPEKPKSKAAELKDALEKRQVGQPDITDKLKPGLKDGKTGNSIKASVQREKVGKSKAAKKLKPLQPKADQIDMVDSKLLVVPTSPLFIAGKKLKDAVAQEELIKDVKAEAALEVLKCMKKAKRYNYSVEGYRFELDHKGAIDKVRVVKPK